MNATGTEARVCQDIADRQAKGLQKYGTTVEGNPLGLLQWYKHHYEELLDAAVYVKRIIEVMEGAPATISACYLPPALDASKLGPAEAQSVTLEDGSTLTATGPVQNDPHAELRKTWKPGQRWQYRSAGTHDAWTDRGGQPCWFPDAEYRRHPDDIDPQKDRNSLLGRLYMGDEVTKESFVQGLAQNCQGLGPAK